MASRLQLPDDDSVVLRVTHANVKSFSADVRFSLEMTVESVKEKLWKKCGTAVDSMVLELYDDAGSKVCDLSDATRPFGFYSPRDGLAGPGKMEWIHMLIRSFPYLISCFLQLFKFHGMDEQAD
ncbi:CAP-Gly domain [Musa troglodytarum]|uniref:CAP-Gly domain n=1 Tax=Musa troglodytarum TaxID=320322 RepID=A0A9E7H3X6_9LILI|nr:CAP-Gly domain [Musa troglodytarum]